MKTEITFSSHGVTCAAWHFPASTAPAEPTAPTEPPGKAGEARKGRRPCVVMAHGFGGTRDTGLLGYAEGFAAAGVHAFLFDYRGFGDSDGMPRQDVSFRRQRQDYHAAITAARRLPGVDPARIAVWGTSYSGGHVIAVGARDERVAAVISMTPVTDGLAVLAQIARYAGLGQLARLTGHGLRDAARALTGREAHHVLVVGPPGSAAIISAPGTEEAYTSMAGPTWRNEVCARTALEAPLNRPTALTRSLTCPVLIQVGQNDRVAPPAAARRTARNIGPLAELREYPIDHFDVYDGPGQRQALADQISFLSRALGPPDVTSPEA